MSHHPNKAFAIPAMNLCRHHLTDSGWKDLCEKTGVSEDEAYFFCITVNQLFLNEVEGEADED